jgi:hypothetical protein
MVVANNAGVLSLQVIPNLIIRDGLNTYTGGTAGNYTVNVSGATFDNIFVSGSSRFNTLSASTFSGGTFISGSTNIDTIFATQSSLTNLQTLIQPGINTYTGGTSTRPTVNVTGLSINTITASGDSTFVNISGNSINLLGNALITGVTYTGKLRIVSTSTPQISLHNEVSTGFHFDGNHRMSFHNLGVQTFVASSAGTMAIGTVNSVNENYKLHVSGDTLFENGLTANTLSGQTIQSNSLIGGSTQMVVANAGGVLSVQAIPSAGQSTIIRNGLNTYTGGTTADYTVNVSAATLDNIFVSGSSRFNTLSASTLSGGTMISGTTNLYNIFITSATTVGTGSNLIKDVNGSLIRVRSLVQGSNITLTQNADDITIEATASSGSNSDYNNSFLLMGA